jgi:hypothetical protein
MTQHGETTEQRLNIIQNSPVSTNIEGNEEAVTYSAKLPFVEPFRAVHEYGDPDNEAFLYLIEVPEDLRGHGIATRIMGSLAYHLLNNGYDKLVTSVDSEYTIKIFRRLFGEENIRFRDYSPEPRQEYVLPMTVDQAIASIGGRDRGWNFREYNDQNVPEKELFINVDVDLRALSTSGPETPTT